MKMITKKPARIALPKKGRLAEAVTGFLSTTGLTPVQTEEKCDFGNIVDAGQGYSIPLKNVEIVYQREKDALANMGEGIVDSAIVGLDKFREYESKMKNQGKECSLSISGKFKDVSVCKLVMSGKRTMDNPQQLTGFRIATTYPSALAAWLKAKNVQGVEIIEREGGIEDYVRMGRVDAICDIVETGRSLKANKLCEIFTLFKSYAVLVERTAQNDNVEYAGLNAFRERLLNPRGMEREVA